MAHLTAILIVLTLTGHPVANALCVNWCDLPSERQHCGDAIAQPISATITSLEGSTCGALLAAGPFLREEGRSALFDAITLEAGHAVDTGLTEKELVHVRARGDATRGRPVPARVLRV